MSWNRVCYIYLVCSFAVIGLVLGCVTPEIDWPDDPIPLPTTTTTTQPAQPPVQDTTEAGMGLDMGKVIVHGGEQVKNAEVVAKMIRVDGDKNGCTMYYEPVNFPRYDGETDGFSCLLYRINGQWEGGKYDWKRVSAKTQYTRDFKNIVNGYKGHHAPPNGTECAAFIMSVDGKQRTTCGFFKWE